MDSINPQAPARDFFGSLGVKAYRYRTLIRRQWWVLALTIGIGLAYQAWLLSNQPRLFESTSQLNIREQLNIDESVRQQQQSESFVGTTLTMLRSPEVIERARQRLALEAADLSGTTPEISTTLLPRTSIFLVTGTGPNPEFTRRFVDSVVTEFNAFRMEQMRRTVGSATDSFSDQITALRKELGQQKAEMDAYVAVNNMPGWSEQLKRSADFLSDLKTQQAQLQTELNRLENLTPEQLLTSASASTAQPSASNAGNSAVPNQDGVKDQALYSQYVQTVQALNSAQARLDERSKVWKPKHPRLQVLKKEVDDVQRLLDVIKGQNRSATEARVSAIRGELRSLEASIELQNKNVLEASKKDAAYQALNQNVEYTKSLIDKLLTSQTRVSSGPMLDALTILAKASAPVEVPKGTTRHLLMGLIGGLVVGVLILLLLDRADDRLNSSSEILDRFNEPILGQIPNVSDSRDSSGLPLLQPDDERYTYTEAFRSLRSSLIFMPGQTELRTVLITSAIPNEGKSTIASNLAVTMAAAGARVLLVDADLRRGDLAALFDTDGRTGLSNVLRGEVPWKDAVQQTRYPLLDLMPRGPVTSQSSEMLLLPSVNALLEEAKAQYDLAIFNTAPILATDDTPTLAPHFDGTLMVVRAQFTSSRLTQNALNALYQRQVNVFGLILNCVDTEMPDYYYYRYPKYYAA